MIDESSEIQEERQARTVLVHGRWTGYRMLLMARLKEMFREPEVIFWIFLFPILLALGLGIAFRNKPAEAVRVVVVQQAGSERVAELLSHSPEPHTLKVAVQPPDRPTSISGLANSMSS